MQQQLKAFLILFMTVFGLAACGSDPSSPEGVRDDMIDGMNEMNKVLKKITDKESAEEQKPALLAVGLKLKDVKERMDELEKNMSKEDMEAFKMSMISMLAPAMEMMGEMQRVQQIEGVEEVLGDSLDAMK